MGLFGKKSEADKDIVDAVVEPRDKETMKAVNKSAEVIQKRIAECGGELTGVAYSFFHGILVITTNGFFDPLTRSVVKLSDIRGADVTNGSEGGVISIASRTQARVTFQFRSSETAYRVQELLGAD